MKRSERMKIVHSVAEHEERQECRTMGEAQKSLQDEIDRLEELKACRQVYASKEELRKGVHTMQWQDYHRFLRRLDQAVAAQQQIVRDGKSLREAHRNRWMIKRQRQESLSRIVERFKKVEFDEIERQIRNNQDSQRILPSPYDPER